MQPGGVIIFVLTSLLMTCLVLMMLPLKSSSSRHDSSSSMSPMTVNLETGDAFSFIPGRKQSLGDCDNLFVETHAAGFELSTEYATKREAFETEVKRVVSIIREYREGYSHQVPTMFKAMHYIASRPTVKHICETGFNLGHSSFNFLTASKQTIVHSFDLGNHKYAHKMADYMNRTFTGRFFVRFGDSTKTVCCLFVNRSR